MKKGHEGKLFVISGPSGVGKGTLRARALEGFDDLVYSISCTTRPPREGEREGMDYRFISEQEFLERVRQGQFLEYARVHGAFYGTLRSDVERDLAAGLDVLLEIDVQGALQVKQLLPSQAILIFVSPPSVEELERRLRWRHTETEDKIRVRIANAKEELLQADKYDHVVLNDDLFRAAEELKNIIYEYRGKVGIKSEIL
ncbi:MAG: guanylate kinase [Fretibacterium sp.]|nr:guanylate kinase [Fretibacterium sp.]